MITFLSRIKICFNFRPSSFVLPFQRKGILHLNITINWTITTPNSNPHGEPAKTQNWGALFLGGWVLFIIINKKYIGFSLLLIFRAFPRCLFDGVYCCMMPFECDTQKLSRNKLIPLKQSFPLDNNSCMQRRETHSIVLSLSIVLRMPAASWLGHACKWRKKGNKKRKKSWKILPETGWMWT